MPENEDEFSEGLGDFVRDALALVEAVAKEDEQGIEVILEQANPRVLARGVALIAEQCAIQGAVLGGQISEHASRQEQYAARDEVLRRVRQHFGQAGLA